MRRGPICAAMWLALILIADPLPRVAQLTFDCDAKKADACYQLAAFNSLGIDMPKDSERASSLRERACDLGNAEACAEAAGNDLTRSKMFLLRACKLGFEPACAPDKPAPASCYPREAIMKSIVRIQAQAKYCYESRLT